MKFDSILYATQYYRSPTPLEDEWEKDLFLMSQYNLNTIQIRINWRTNERIKDQYNFDDVDKLFDLAERYNKKVIVKFLLECAPNYIFNEYEGTRIGPKGEKIRAGYHGAFYGGWQPCFSNPKIRERASLFVKKVVERYKDRKSLIMFNAWNEIRNRPIEDCFCKYCKKNFQDYLKDKYKTIEAYNKFYGCSEESFESLDLPSMSHGFFDILEFKRFKGSEDAKNKVQFVIDAIRSLDLIHPIASHVGYCGAFQNHLGDVIDDLAISNIVDIFGTSIPCDTTMDSLTKRLEFNLLNDYMRGINKDYFIYEVYPGLGMFKYSYDTPFDMEYKLYTSLASGVKGLCFWQYRSERIAHECDCAGLMHMDGSPRPVINSVKEVGDFINQYGKLLANSYEKQAEIAIICDFDNMLLSEIEDSSGVDYTFDLYGPVFAYNKSLKGFYRLIKTNNMDIDFIDSRNIKDIFKYKIIYLPYFMKLNDEIKNEISKYVAIGGRVILDEGFAIRDINTWLNPYDFNLKPMVDIRSDERRRCGGKFIYKDNSYDFSTYRTTYKLNSDSEVYFLLDNNYPALQSVNYGRGKLYLFAFSFGASYFDFNNDVYLDILNEILLNDLSIKPNKYSSIKNNIESRTLLTKDNKEILFIYNLNDSPITLDFDEEFNEIYGNYLLKDNKLTLGNKKSIFVFKK